MTGQKNERFTLANLRQHKIQQHNEDLLGVVNNNTLYFKDEETPRESIVYIKNNSVGGLGETTNVEGMTQL